MPESHKSVKAPRMYQYDQFCMYCGTELVKSKKASAIYSNMDWITLICPKKRWWNTGHSEITTNLEIKDTFLNYDPFTGERISK